MTDKKKQLTLPSWADQLGSSKNPSKNRYQVLGQIPPKLEYKSALAYIPSPSQCIATDPFCSQKSIQTSQSSQPNYPVKTSTPTEYLLKPVTTKLFSIEPVHQNVHQPFELVNSFFPPGWHFVPAHPDKSLSFYRDILQLHKSILIKPIKDKINPNKVIYHSLYIHNIVSLDQWGHPSVYKKLPDHPVEYNYYDYIDAWFKILLYENEGFTHSWFIQFDHKFNSVIPSWFNRWWHQNGAIPDILPTELLDQVNYFATINKVTDHTSQFPALLLFVSKYKVPWILKWRYNIEDRTVIRQYLVKWWGSYNHQKIINQVMLEFPVKVPTPVKISTPVKQVQPVKQEDTLVQSDSPTVSNIRLNSPAQRSSRTSKSKTKCS
ncbi:hypothetical protein RHMOL_Rhmol01G0124300 [Rhododendron molle]|uniref:Uncharacterized protein n=1 Tax=Rhododendron molle TaxID=49168 RepID=A0ACC0Q193_RHOML|nr:hypothetical protein RHMOL_Rhmol01G0124300 [Rhododendron molle]